ncbi:hypothetical protein L1987_04265 [Smallanthus sonchifolius]|uniref:Uncharacterized protein n=1 Tax=Smallanthus sonchifolius TaxID=185202 RepID=A0ACB9KCU1_9ASTR|nr:hypothetical protein L1987_04265 [Smallanthus sonchifolius]
MFWRKWISKLGKTSSGDLKHKSSEKSSMRVRKVGNDDGMSSLAIIEADIKIKTIKIKRSIFKGYPLEEFEEVGVALGKGIAEDKKVDVQWESN